MRTNLVVVVVALLAVSAAGVWYFTKDASGDAASGLAPASGAAATAVEAQTVEVKPLERSIESVGNLMSNESVILSPEISGRISEILFQEGQSVTAGTPLVKLDDSVYRAELATAEAQLPLAQANSTRAQKLLAQQSGTERARDEALSTLKTTQARIELARAQLQKTVITAPFDGVIGLRRVSVGNYVTPGQDMVNLESIDPIKVDFKMPEVYLGMLKVGQVINVRMDAFPNRTFPGEVYAIDPRIESSGRTVLLRARLDNDENILRPGLFARVNLVVDRRDAAVIIPEQAIIPQGNEQFVYRAVDGKAVLTKVVTGLRRMGTVEITEGLSAGDVIVTAGQLKLRPDSAITVLDKTKPVTTE